MSREIIFSNVLRPDLFKLIYRNLKKPLWRSECSVNLFGNCRLLTVIAFKLRYSFARAALLLMLVQQLSLSARMLLFCLHVHRIS